MSEALNSPHSEETGDRKRQNVLRLETGFGVFFTFFFHFFFLSFLLLLFFKTID